MSKDKSSQGINKLAVEITIETFDYEHIAKIVEALTNAGFEIK